MTQKKYLHFEDEVEVKSNRKIKHSTNQKGRGMKVLNSYVEEYYEEDLDYDFETYNEDDNTNTKTH